jgi:Na+/pantothenate symporter
MKLSVLAPNVDAKLVVATGVSELRQAFNDEEIDGILHAYMDGLRLSFLLCIVLAGVTLVISAFAEWVNLKGRIQGGAAAWKVLRHKYKETQEEWMACQLLFLFFGFSFYHGTDGRSAGLTFFKYSSLLITDIGS